MALRLVVLGTGTEVGKTHVACELARTALGKFDSIIALKPVETGVPANSPALDATALWTAARQAEKPVTKGPGLPEPAAKRALVGDTPRPTYCFEPAVSAHLAAREAGTAIDTTVIRDWVGTQERLFHPSASSDSLTIVETAGGALSPLGPGLTNLDLATAMEPSLWLLVAPDALGVLHDVSATLASMGAIARPPDAVILSAARATDASTGSNARELEDLGIARPAVTFSRGTPPDLRPFWSSLRYLFPPGNR